MTFSPVSYLPNAEDRFKQVPLSEASSITREDNKIVLTTKDALNYLNKALKNQQIYQNYGKYFAYLEHQARVDDFEKRINPNPEELQDFKTNLVTEICSSLSEGVKENLKINTLQKIIELSLKGLALDQKTGTLFLITKNQRNKEYSLTTINATNLENPSQKDWKRRVDGLSLVDREIQGDRFTHPNLINNGCKFSIAHNTPADDPIPPYAVKFIWENTKEEINPSYIELKLVTGENLDRKYLQIKTREEELYFKSHSDEIPPLLHSDEIPPLLTDELPAERSLFEFFQAEIPSNGCCFIDNNTIKELFLNRPQVKSARNLI